MADIAITAANVVKGSGASTSSGTAGASITAGQTLYLDSATNTLKLADANSTAATAACVGIALHAASSNQPIQYLTQGPITIGGTLTAGVFYIASATAGGVAPASDATTGWIPCQLGYASSTTVLQVGIVNTGVTL